MSRVTLENISDSRFTEATIRRMFEFVDAAKTDEKFQKLIYGVVNRQMHGQWKNYAGEIETVFNWFRSRHDYRRDPHGVELLQDVWATLDRKRYDCDDSSIFLAAAAEVLGAPARFITVSTRPDHEPSHVYPEAYVGGRWQALDATVPGAYFGWRPEDGITDRKVWTRRSLGLSGDDDLPIEGLGMNDQSMPEGWTNDRYNARANGRSRPGSWEGGFANRMFVVNPTGFPNDVSQSFAPGIPGSETIVRREIESDLVAELADQRKMEAAGGGVYSPEYPIMSFQSPAEFRTVIPAADVPLVFNKNLWTGTVPDSIPQDDYTLPQPFVDERKELMDLAGLGNHDSNGNGDDGMDGFLGSLGLDPSKITPEEREAIRHEYHKCVHDARHAYQQAVHAAEKEKHAKIAACRATRKSERETAAMSDYFTQRWMDPQQLSGLGAFDWRGAAEAIAGNIVSGVSGGTIPASQVSSAIDKAVTAVTGVPPKTPTVVNLPTVAKASAFGLGTLIPIGIAAYIIFGMKGKGGGSRRRYRRNSVVPVSWNHHMAG